MPMDNCQVKLKDTEMQPARDHDQHADKAQRTDENFLPHTLSLLNYFTVSNIPLRMDNIPLANFSERPRAMNARSNPDPCLLRLVMPALHEEVGFALSTHP